MQQQQDISKLSREALELAFRHVARRLANRERRNETLVHELTRARIANSRYFYELSRMKPRSQLVVCYMGEHDDYFHRRWRVWTIWLNGVRIGRSQCIADNADQPEELWQIVETLERALDVKHMKAALKQKAWRVPPMRPWGRR